MKGLNIGISRFKFWSINKRNMCKSEVVQAAQFSEQKQAILECNSINLFWGTLGEINPMLGAKNIVKVSSEPEFFALHLEN